MWIRFWRPWRKLLLRRAELVEHVELRGIEHLEAALAKDQGVLITPNHYTYADPYLLYEAADHVARPFYVMTAWQVFGTSPWIKQQVLRHHGGFSVDRDGIDHRSVRTASEILERRPYPLVIFPEGEMYRISDRIMPFYNGPARIALSAAKKSKRPIVVVPAALKYYYLDDPLPNLLTLMDQLENSVYWRPSPSRPLPDRIYRLGEAVLALKELEFIGRTSSGPFPERLVALATCVLQHVETRLNDASSGSLLARVKRLRSLAVDRLETLKPGDPQRNTMTHVLDDLFLVVQLTCYPGDYVTENPTVERMAETIDKLEEDLLGVAFAKPRARRAAIVAFGPAISVVPQDNRREATSQLTGTLEASVRSLLNGIIVPARA